MVSAVELPAGFLTVSIEFMTVVTEIRQNKEKCKEFLQTESCIVLISNVVEGNSSRELLGIYKGQMGS